MFNSKRVMNKLAKGLATGAGVFASTFVGDTIDEFVPGGDTGTALGQMAVGAGVAVASDRIAPGDLNENQFSVDAGLAESAVEHFGYGIHGAGFAEFGDMIQTGAQTGQTVTVRANADNARSGMAGTSDYSLDTA